MQLKYILSVLSLGFVLMAQAAEVRYPEKIFGGPSLESVEGIYGAIYDDVHEESNEEIFRRMKQHNMYESFGYTDPKFLFVNNLKNTDLEVLIVRGSSDVLQNTSTSFWENLGLGDDSNSSDEFIKDRDLRLETVSGGKLSKFDQQQVLNDIQALYEEEKQLLRSENNLARELTMKSIFADDNGQNYVPFDLVEDLNEFDQIWLGPEAKNEDPGYTHIDKEDVRDYEWNEEFDGYQKQIGDTSEGSSSGYGKPVQGDGASFAESLGRIYKAVEELEQAGSLSATCVSKRLFEPPFLRGQKDYSCENALAEIELPGIPEPEDEEERRTIGGRAEVFGGLMKQVFERENCVEYSNDGLSVETTVQGVNTFLVCGDARENQLQSIERQLNEDIEKEILFSERQRSDESFESLNRHAETVLALMSALNKTNQCIASRPQF